MFGGGEEDGFEGVGGGEGEGEGVGLVGEEAEDLRQIHKHSSLLTTLC